MHHRFCTRLAAGRREDGFTLIEVLVVVVILGILLSFAVPAYLTFRSRASESAAQANVRAAVPSAEAYFADNGTYSGMDTAALQARDPSVQVTVLGASNATSYCLRSTNQPYHYKQGPAGAITTTPCSGP